MNALRNKLLQLAKAMEFANIERLDQLQGLLERHEPIGAPLPADAAPQRAERRRPLPAPGRVIDFSAFGGRTGLGVSGRGH